jgi:hypothetical protein
MEECLKSLRLREYPASFNFLGGTFLGIELRVLAGKLKTISQWCSHLIDTLYNVSYR